MVKRGRIILSPVQRLTSSLPGKSKKEEGDRGPSLHSKSRCPRGVKLTRLGLQSKVKGESGNKDHEIVGKLENNCGVDMCECSNMFVCFLADR